MKLYLIRHGQTERNVKSNQFVGQSSNEPLTDFGKKQAELLGKRFRRDKLVFDKVYSSPYDRAKTTCLISCKQEPIIADELREYSTGEAEDKNRAEVFTYDAVMEMVGLGMHFGHKGGETLYEVEKRAAKWLYQVMQEYQNTEYKIAAFSHGMTIKTIMHYIMEFDQKMTWRINLDNTSITHFEFKLGQWFLNGVNDTRHLGEIE